ncbi:uncharacterized protein LOC127704282 [Mytilus californianus]|uniref:uncharacterized protein LOC127704282 n=1 Tax=Mytilus californianus TaxID=6549 RepID=UPI002245F7E1|nr:uncharacterized protein LOC127704282 [Mytilus californianus]
MASEEIEAQISNLGSDLEQNLRTRESTPRERSSSRVRSRSESTHKGRGRNKSKISSIHTDESYTGLSFNSLPSSTSHWTLICLESVGVYYKDKALSVPGVFDMVYEHTGLFETPSSDQIEFVKKLKDEITFSFSISDLSRYNNKGFYRETFQNLKKDLPSPVEDFTTSTLLLVHYAIEREKYGGKISEAVFKDLFKSFVKMVNLVPGQGEEWTSQMTILQQDVTSESNVVIMTKDFLNSIPPSIVSVVSIVEVKNLCGGVNESSHLKTHMKTRPIRGADLETASSCSEKSVHEEPAIYRRIPQAVLGQHGGELLVHARAYGGRFASKKKRCRLHPGMIVIGTRVTLTVLEYNFDHMDELQNNSENENSRSYIYYSEPKDFLKKEDRDLLMESFIRLSNIKPEC